MKRDWELIRKILIKLEQMAEESLPLKDDQFEGVDPDTVSYHFKIMGQAELIETDVITIRGNSLYSAKAITWQGHEFLDKIRNDTVWNKSKAMLKNKGIDLSFDVLKSAATTIISQLIP